MSIRETASPQRPLLSISIKSPQNLFHFFTTEAQNTGVQTIAKTSPLILVVEDEPEMLELMEAYLRRDGYRTEHALDGERALDLFRAAQPDLVLLDIQLPRISGFDVLKTIRQKHLTPVIMVTARAEDLDKLLGLELGADDYVVKPFSPREVVARVKAVLRRTQQHTQTVVRIGDLEVDSNAMLARVGPHRLDLTPAEFRLLEYLARHPGRACSRQELLEASLPNSDALERVVDTHLKNLRRKLELAGALGMLETVRGVGYRLWLEN